MHSLAHLMVSHLVACGGLNWIKIFSTGHDGQHTCQTWRYLLMRQIVKSDLFVPYTIMWNSHVSNGT